MPWVLVAVQVQLLEAEVGGLCITFDTAAIEVLNLKFVGEHAGAANVQTQVICQCSLASARDNCDVIQPGVLCLLNAILNQRRVDDAQYVLIAGRKRAP